MYMHNSTVAVHTRIIKNSLGVYLQAQYIISTFAFHAHLKS